MLSLSHVAAAAMVLIVGAASLGAQASGPQHLRQLPGTAVALPDARTLFPWITGLPTAPLPDKLPGLAGAIPEPPSRVWWTVSIAAPPGGAPLVHGEHVFVPRLPSTLLALRIEDGEEAWSVEIAPEQPLAADGGLLFVVAGEAIHALKAADGSVAWRRPVGTLTAPVLAKDGWLLVHERSQLVALRAANGTPVWTVASGPQRERAAVSGDLLVVPLADGHLEGRRLTTGALLWRQRIGGAPGEPLIARDEVFVGATDRVFYSLDGASGNIRWPYRVGATPLAPPSTDGTRVFFSAVDNVVRALDLGNGALKWHRGMPFRPLAAPVAIGDFVLVAGPVEGVRILRAGTGKDAGTLVFAQRLAAAPAIAERGGAILVAAATGGLEETWSVSVAAWPRTAPPPRANSPTADRSR